MSKTPIVNNCFTHNFAENHVFNENNGNFKSQAKKIAKFRNFKMHGIKSSDRISSLINLDSLNGIKELINILKKLNTNHLILDGYNVKIRKDARFKTTKPYTVAEVDLKVNARGRGESEILGKPVKKDAYLLLGVKIENDLVKIHHLDETIYKQQEINHQFTVSKFKLK